MDGDTGLRERKKRRTRRELTTAALRLFEEQGYAETSVARIVEEAGVSRATFFNYFTGKEDVLFADNGAHETLVRSSLGERRTGETPAEALLRSVDELLNAQLWSIDPAGPLVSVRARLIAAEPALRARALLVAAELQVAWAGALHAAYADELDEAEAAALTGAAVGAMLGTAGHLLRSGVDPEALPERVREAAAIALGLR